MGNLVCRIQYATQHGTQRRLLSDGEVCEMQEWDSEEGAWANLSPDWIDERDVALAVGALKPKLKQEVEIESGTLEGVKIPYESPTFIDQLKAWCRMRREKGKRVTKTVAERQMKKLALWGEQTATEALSNAADAGWTDVYHPKRWKPGVAEPPPHHASNMAKLRIHR